MATSEQESNTSEIKEPQENQPGETSTGPAQTAAETGNKPETETPAAPATEPAPAPEQNPAQETPVTPEPAPAPEPTPAKETPATPQTSEKTAKITPVHLESTAQNKPVGPVEKIAMDEAAQYGRIDAEGRVFVKDGDTEREVGQYADGIPEQPFALYVRRFLDLQAQVDLAQARLATLKAHDIDATLKSLDKAMESPMVVGNLAGLRSRVEKLRELGAARKEQLAEEREVAKAQALETRNKIVQAAEKIAAQDPERTQWKQSGERLRELLESWKDSQRKGPRIDRATEDALWKRFSAARTSFDRHRKSFFSQLDAKRAEVRSAKEALIKRAEELANSTDWARTSAAYRDLMTEWKAAGRASRKDDDALWERFRAAQQVFFDARSADNAKTNTEEQANLEVKEKLLEQAKALMPVKDLETTKAKFRDLLDKWDEAGRVPRGDMQRLENGLRSVEQAIAKAENEAWVKSNPETKARAEGLVGQLEEKIAKLETEIAAAKQDGKDTKKLEEDLQARKGWLDQARKAAAE
ncbi:DUF349 domain-containing protein [uncultured Mobiluncus sp.]|uniref:DUF349 domain-containing protein n=1 Tax=uncultured Mobiluncus sp. TaxID=293425 RepID=UPI0025E10841|nr:DUF349 domain-containing protein [uncultured Mobiluncus sp.]